MAEKRAKTSFSLLFAASVFINLKSYAAAVDARDTLSLGASLAGNRTLISKNGTFELGFFSPNGTNNWYIGIWFANLPEKTIVWVANREIPARNKPGILKLSREGKLDLFDAEGETVWSVNTWKKASRAVLLDSGNFIVLSNENKNETVWQSFDNPTDTWLPAMRFGGRQKLVSWKSRSDPAPGLFSHQADPSGAKQFVHLWNNSVKYWESGVWNGKIFSNVPEMANQDFFNISVETNGSSLYDRSTPTRKMHGVVRFIMMKSGDIRHLVFDGSKWNMFWSAPRDECAVYALCGPFAICSSGNLQFCSCVNGFTPKDNEAWDSREWWSSGCVRQSPLNCSTDIFVDSNSTLPNDYYASSYPAPTKKDCENACLSNCSCTAYVFSLPSGPCHIWSGTLLGLRNTALETNSNVFVRVAASALPNYEPRSPSKFKPIFLLVLCILASIVILAGIFSFLMWRRRQDRLRFIERCEEYSSDPFLRMFSYKELKIATRNFKSKLGSGGFGSVFKGSLPDGALVAVKKLESSSSRDDKQFRAEISSLGNIYHANLVRLRGFCVQGPRRLLVYDYMPNGSLSSLLFPRERKVLCWETRFQIALGTARALFYLHEECRDHIIHGDVKPDNILLDVDFAPKLADFGMAKLVSRDFSRIVTTTRGTRGYLAPEWISGLPITPKVDVYSFGMTLLEIISGRRTLDFNVEDSSMYYFPPWATAQICRGNTINIVEKGIAEEKDIQEIRRAIVVALLCIDRDENMRPSMGQVVLMLEGKVEPRTSALMEELANSGDNDTDSDSKDDGNVVKLD